MDDGLPGNERMKVRVLIAGLAVLAATTVCGALQQPMGSSDIAHTPTKEPLNGESHSVSHIRALLPEGIISEEVQSLFEDFEDTFLDGKPLPEPFKLEYRYTNSFAKYKIPMIEITQEILFPAEVYIARFPLTWGPLPPRPGETPEPWDFPFPLDIPFGGGSARIIYKGEWASLSDNYGRFKVGEEQTDVFWFLFQQLGQERAIIADSETYEAYWGEERAE